MRRARRRRWTEDEVRRLKLLADGNVSAEYIAKSLERSVTSVKSKAHSLGLTLAQRAKAKMIDKTPGPTVTAMQRQLMQCLSSGDWKSVTKIPVSPSSTMLNRISSYGWIERRGAGSRAEIKLTPAGLVALQARI